MKYRPITRAYVPKGEPALFEGDLEIKCVEEEWKSGSRLRFGLTFFLSRSPTDHQVCCMHNGNGGRTGENI